MVASWAGTLEATTAVHLAALRVARTVQQWAEPRAARRAAQMVELLGRKKAGQMAARLVPLSADN